MMTIYIQQRHINKGKRCSSTHCPIALAVKEKTHKQVFVSGYSIKIKRGSQFIYHALPTAAVDFIKDFDSKVKDNKLVKPFVLHF